MAVKDETVEANGTKESEETEESEDVKSEGVDEDADKDIRVEINGATFKRRDVH